VTSFRQRLASPIKAVDDVVLKTHVPGFCPSPVAQLNADNKKNDHQQRKQGATSKSAGEQSLKERSSGHRLILRKDSSSIRKVTIVCFVRLFAPVICRSSGGSRLFDLIYARLNGVIKTRRMHFAAVLIWWTTPLNYGLPFDTVWARYTPLN
jgi:hypothetical protein